MLSRLTRWIDRDWERRRYLSIIAIAQRLLWVAPILVAIVIMELAEALGASPTGPVTLAILIAGMAGCVFTFSLSMYRWFIGYSRTDWQEKQAAARRGKSAED